MTIIFDLDGTLIDSRKRHWYLMETLLVSHGVPVPENFHEDYMNYKANGNTGKAYLLNCLKLQYETADAIDREWIDRIENPMLLGMDVLYEDTIRVCENLLSREINICYLSLRKNENLLMDEIEALGLGGYPKEIVVLKPETGQRKSDCLLDMKERYGRLMMVGDTEIDLKASENANVESFILNRGFRSKLFWDQRGVTSYESLRELERRISI